MNSVFAIYQILLGWKTYRYYYETNELPNPMPPPNPRKIRLKWSLGHFFPTAYNFRELGLIHIGNRLQETRANQILRKIPTIFLVLVSQHST